MLSPRPFRFYAAGVQLRPLRLVLSFAFIFALACGGGEGADRGPEPVDPHRALLPPACRIPRQGAACRSCVDACCAPCHEGSECIRFRACLQSCGGDLHCLRRCADSHPKGEEDAIEAELCPERACADMCVFIECDEVCAN